MTVKEELEKWLVERCGQKLDNFSGMAVATPLRRDDITYSVFTNVWYNKGVREVNYLDVIQIYDLMEGLSKEATEVVEGVITGRTKGLFFIWMGL
jgi:hypothetical protein